MMDRSTTVKYSVPAVVGAFMMFMLPMDNSNCAMSCFVFLDEIFSAQKAVECLISDREIIRSNKNSLTKDNNRELNGELTDTPYCSLCH